LKRAVGSAVAIGYARRFTTCSFPSAAAPRHTPRARQPLARVRPQLRASVHVVTMSSTSRTADRSRMGVRSARQALL